MCKTKPIFSIFIKHLEKGQSSLPLELVHWASYSKAANDPQRDQQQRQKRKRNAAAGASPTDWWLA
jgi:hypothetical protein